MKIDKKKYKLPESNYYTEEHKKFQIVIGHTYGKDMNHWPRWVNRRNGKYKRTSTFSISKEGNIYQHYDPIYWSSFIGESDKDKSLISISLVNEGWLIKDMISGTYEDWLGNEYRLNEEDIKYKKWRGHSFWMNYSDEQLKSLRWLTKKLCNEFNIELDCIEHNVKDSDVYLYNGICFRSNFKQDRTDISPAFDIKAFSDSLLKVKTKVENE